MGDFIINAIRYTEELEKAGFTKDKAQASVKIWMELMNDEFGLQRMQYRLQAELKEIRHELALFELRLIIKLGTIWAFCVGMLIILIFSKG